MLTRKCVGRVTYKGSSHPCPKEGVKVGRDGRWRCRECHADKYEPEAERSAIEDEGEPRVA